MALSWSLDLEADVTDQLVDAGMRGLALGAELILSESGKLVPHEEGTLERSGSTDVDTEQQRASIYYDTPYAVAQHERMDYRHDHGRQAKYLETAMNANRDRVAELIAAEIRKATT